MVSDTASAAKNVSKHFDDVIQQDCAMHLLSLVVQYGVGKSENTRTSRVNGDRVTTIVTPGGALPRGLEILKALRKLAVFINWTGKRAGSFKKIQELYNYPQLAVISDCDTRVLSSSPLLRRSIINRNAYKIFFDRCSEDERHIFTDIDQSDWILAAELEAITKPIATCVTDVIQKKDCLPSEMLVYIKVIVDALKKGQFMMLDPNGTFYDVVSERDQPRKKISTSELSSDGKICVERLKKQLCTRFADVKPDTLLPLLLDPRTKASLRAIVQSLAPEEDAEEIVRRTKDRFLELHRDLYLNTNISNNKDDCLPILFPSSEQVDDDDYFEDGCASSDTVPLASQEVAEETELKAKADEIATTWLSYNVHWVFVASTQDPDGLRAQLLKEFNSEEVVRTKMQEHYVKKLKMRSSSNWDLIRLMKDINILTWFRDQEKMSSFKHTSVAQLARIFLGKVSTSAYQERVFSISNKVIAKDRTSTDAERAEKQVLLKINKQHI
jgi:hypothetical protein